MTIYKAPQTAIARKLKELRKSRGWSQAAYAEKTKITLDTIKNIESGRTRDPDTATVARICEDFGIEPTFLISEHSYSNYHLVRGNDAKLQELEHRFGPAGRQGLQVGGFVTTWLQYDTCDDARYEPHLVGGVILDEELMLPKPFIILRDQLLRENAERKKRGQKSFHNGPSLCLSRFFAGNTDDGDERSVLKCFFKRSEYANNKTAKGVNGAALRYEALRDWRFLNQPIEFLSSGVGNALMLFTDGGDSAIFVKRSEFEEFRSGDFDVAVVEGIHPTKDVAAEGIIDVYAAARRGYLEECGIDIPLDDIKLIGFGNDLEYYQWNLLGYAVSEVSSSDLIKYWHGAEDRKESEDMFAIASDPVSVLSFCRDRAVWGSGLAAAYFSLCKRHGQAEVVAAANKVFLS
jgi:transcriptional regulator with XRE-family HTH domain